MAAGNVVGAHDELKSAPRGYAKDHPRIDLLRRKGLTVWRGWPVAAWLHTAKAKDRVEGLWRDAGPDLGVARRPRRAERAAARRPLTVPRGRSAAADKRKYALWSAATRSQPKRQRRMATKTR